MTSSSPSSGDNGLHVDVAAHLADLEAERSRCRDAIEDANRHACRAIAKLNLTYSNRHVRAAIDELTKALDVLQAEMPK